jgi:hypothetical protein
MRPVLRSAADYVRDAGRAMIAFLVGAVFTVGGLALDFFSVQVPSRLMVVGGLLLMAWGQFWAYHKLRLRHVESETQLSELKRQLQAARGDRPEVDDRLELLGEVPGLRPPDSEADLREMEALSLQPDPDHMDTIGLTVKREIEPPLLDVRCTGPIYSVICTYLLPEAGLIMSMEPVLREPDRILMRLGEKPLPVGTAVWLKLFSPVPIRLKKIAIGRLR